MENPSAPLESTSLDRFRFRKEFDHTVYYPTLNRALETFLATYGDPEYGLVYHSPISEPGAFPTTEEIRAEIPNSQGWFTAIEDCSFLGPILLGAISRSHCGLSPERRQEIGTLLFKGLVRLWEVPGTGFIARGLNPGGGKEFYPNSSPDQVPNYLRGVWEWARSGLATKEEQDKAQKIFVSVLSRLESYQWELRRSDNEEGLPGSGNITHASQRNSAQFLAMFAMAADLTGDSKWVEIFRQFRDEKDSIRLTFITSDDSPTWLPWQMELVIEALRVLQRLDSDPIAQLAYAKGIRRMGALASIHIAGYGLWSTPSRTPAPPVTLSLPPAIEARPDFRPGYRLGVELGLDLKTRFGQVMQGRIIEKLAVENGDAPNDGRTPLSAHLFALSIVAQSGMPRSKDGVRVQSDTRDNWTLVAEDILKKTAPDIPWNLGAVALACFFSAWECQAEDPRY